MSTWHTLIRSERLPPGAVIEICWEGNDLLIYRTAKGALGALTAYCPHMGNYIPNGLAPGQPLASLLVAEALRCPYHGWCFDGEGRCTHIPQGQRVPEVVRRGGRVARNWRVREHDSQIQLRAG